MYLDQEAYEELLDRVARAEERAAGYKREAHRLRDVMHRVARELPSDSWACELLRDGDVL